MTTKTLKKPKTMREEIASMPIGSELFIPFLAFKPQSVRVAISEFNKRGYSYTASEKGLSDGIKVTRLK